MSGWPTLLSRAAGKWQLPLLGASLVALPLAVALLRPRPASMELADAAESLRILIDTQAYDHAVGFAEAVLAREDCQGTDAARFHLLLGRARYGSAVSNDRKTGNTGRGVIQAFRAAGGLGQPLSADDYMHLGHALEWTRQFRLALDSYHSALDGGQARALDLRRHMIGLRRDELSATAEELSGAVDQLLADIPAGREDLLLWTVQEKLHLLDELGLVDQAEPMLAESRRRFPQPELEAEFDYFRGWVLHACGRQAEAEALLRDLRNRVSSDDPVVLKAGWLLGRVILHAKAERAEEALSFFRHVLLRQDEGLYATASRLGSAEALAWMRRDAEALEAFRHSIEDLQKLERSRIVNRDMVRTTLGVLAEMQRQCGSLRPALGYAELAVALVDYSQVEQAVGHLQQLAVVQQQLAERLREDSWERPSFPEQEGWASHDDARQLFAAAAHTYEKLSEIDVHNERRAAEAAWRAAEMYAQAGSREVASRHYERFAQARPQHALVPRALLRIGQLRQAAGRFADAIEAYQACYRKFPKMLDGIRTLVPLAQCYVAMGPDHLDLAEKTLRIVLEDSDVFTPQAPEFADALFLLGDVLERRGEFEKAIGTLHEVIDRYPSDVRAWRAKFLLADCYRQSALALKQEAGQAQFEGEIEQIRGESRARFGTGRSLYRQIIGEYEARGPGKLTRLETVYLRHAYLYEADCCFEAQEYREALRLYEHAAGIFSDQPSGLAAYVQMIHCHVFLGEARPARTALARAKVVLQRMDKQAFAQGVFAETSEDWRQYLQWLDDSELF